MEIDSGEAVPLLGNDVKDEKAAPKFTLALVLTCITCSFTGASLGFDVGVMADAIVYIKKEWDLTFFEEEFCLGILNFVAAFGTLLALGIADKFGRRATVGVACVLLAVGQIFMGASTNYAWLMLGRVICGSGIGITFVVAPIYISEISPADIRGSMGALFEVAINTGLCLGYLVGYLCGWNYSSTMAWRVMFYSGAVAPTFILLCLGFLPESPRWLVVSGYRAEAIDALTQVGDSDAEATVKLIEEELVNTRDALNSDDKEQQLEADNRAIYVAMAIGFVQQIGGCEAILYYSSNFLDDAGMTSDFSQMLGELAIGFSKLLPVIIFFPFIDNFGRRTCLIGSAAGVTMVLVLLVVDFSAGDEPHITVALLCCYMLFYSCGMGLVTWTTTSEMLPSHVRTRGMVGVAFVNRFASGTIAMSALSIVNAVGYTGLFAVYSTLSCTALAFYIAMVPETSKRPLEDIAADLRRHR